MEQQSYDKKYMIWITRIESTWPRVVCYWNMSEVKEGKLKYNMKENKENQSNNAIKQRNKMKKTRQKDEK